MTGDSRYIEVMEVTEYKEVDTMCEMFDRAVNKGIEAGIKQASAIINEKEEQIKDKEEQIKDKEKQIKNKEKHRTISDERLKKPQNVNNVAEVIKLLTERGILLKEFAKKEVCDMTVAQFSRDDILKYGAREEGREEGSILGTIKTLEDLDYSDLQIVGYLIDKCKLEKEEAERYVLSSKIEQ